MSPPATLAVIASSPPRKRELQAGQAASAFLSPLKFATHMTQSQNAQSPKLSMVERLHRIKSLIGTSRKATLHLSDTADSEFHDISEVLEFAEAEIGECAEQLEEKGGKG